MAADGAARAAILDRLVGMLREHLHLALEGETLTEETGLLGQGIGLDSVEVLQLVGAIEEAYGLTIADDDLRGEYFATLGTVVRFVEEQLAR